MIQLLRDRRTRLYVLGDAASNLGDYALFLAMAIWVKQLTGSTSAAGLVMFAFMVGSVLLPVAGLVVDRLPRRWLLVGANLALAAVVLLLLLVRGRDQYWLIYVVMFLYGSLGSVTGPAQQALLPQIVPDEQLGHANGLLQTVRGVLRLFAPIIGAGLFAWLGGGAVAAIDAATFLVGAACLIAIRLVEVRPERKERRSFLAETAAGIATVARTAVLRQFIAVSALAMLALGLFESIGIAVVTQGLGHAPTFLGVLGIGTAVGTIAGGATAGGLVERAGERRAALVGLIIVAAGSAAMRVPVDAAVVLGAGLLGLAAPWIVVSATTALQRNTPAEVHGRVFAAFELGVTVPQTVSVALGAALIAVVDYTRLMYGVVAAALTAAAYLATRPATAPADGPVADPPAVPDTAPAR